MSLRTVRAGAIILLGTLLGASRAVAQAPSCASDPYAAERLEEILPIFQSEEYVEIRQSLGIRAVAADAPVGVPTEPQECMRLLAAAQRAWQTIHAKDSPDGVTTTLSEQDLSYFRVGDYYLVLALPAAASTGDIVLSGLAPLLVFSRDGFGYLGYINR